MSHHARHPWWSSLWLLIGVGIGGVLLLTDSFWHHQGDVQGCAMSYSRPMFLPVPVESRLTKYALYLYRENYVDDVEHWRGMPALFIPGHAGSYKQARSIAAEAANYRSQQQQHEPGLDFFTVELNEDLSALSGQLIEDQAEFLNDAVRAILKLYEGRGDGTVALVGHSMGGVAARVMLTLPNYVKGSIHTILTLATPHAAPPIILDPKMVRLYRRLETGTPFPVTIVSLAGGTPDTTVNSDMTQLPDHVNHLTVFSTAVPRVWTGGDHQAILWCNQLVQIVASALVEVIGEQSRTALNPHQRMRVFRDYFVEAVLPTDVSNEETLSTMSPQMSPQMSAPFSSRVGVKTLIPILQGNSFGLISNLPLRPREVMLCREDHSGSLLCAKVNAGRVLPKSTHSNRLPHEDPSHPFEFVELKPSDLEGFQYIKISTDAPVAIDFYDATAKTLLNVRLWDIIRGGLKLSTTKLSTTFLIPAINHPLLAYSVRVSMLDSDEHTFAPIMGQKMGQKGQTKYHVNINAQSVPLHFYGDGVLELRFWTPRPLIATLEIDWYGSAGKWFLRYGSSLAHFTSLLAAYVLVLRVQNQILVDDILPFEDALLTSMKRLTLVIGLGYLCLPASDTLLLGIREPALLSWALPLFFFVISGGLLASVYVILKMTTNALRCIFSRIYHVNTQLDIALVVLLIGEIQIIPVSTLFCAFYVGWFILTCASYGDDKVYHYRLTVLLCLTSWLSYQIPATFVYVRDLMAGWLETPSLESILDQVPVLISMIVFLLNGTLSLRASPISLWYIHGAQAVLWTYTLYGVKNPYPLHTLLADTLSVYI